MTKKRFWITQSEPGASILARKLTDSGRLVMKVPVICIKPLKFDTPADIPSLVICLSGHAARLYLASDLFKGDLKIPHVAVGRMTASILRACDIEPIVPALENSKGILALQELRKIIASDVVWILSGAGGLGLVESSLSGLCKIIKVRLYERLETRVDNVAPAEIGCILASSVTGVTFAEKIWRRNNGALSIPLVVPSKRVEKTARDLGFRVIHNVGSANVSDVARYVKRFINLE